jgi:LacI family transcriptional regulator
MKKKKSKHPTLSEVAKKAGVGTTTVSRVINGGQRVDPKTLARVQQVIDTLGYLPNQAARILKGDRTRTIGLVIPSIADPFFSSCAEVTQAIARAHDSLLIVLTTQNDVHAELESVKVLLRHRADGFILTAGNPQSQLLRSLLARVQVPIVALDRPIEGLSIPSVVADNFAGAQMATQHLINHQYRRIACLTGEITLYTIHERISGYQTEIKSAGLEVMLDTSIKDYRSAEYAVERMLAAANPPEAILTLKNSTTIFVFEALQKLGVAIPERVALLGFDDFELAATVRPSISVVQQPIEALGRSAADLLFARMRGGVEKEQAPLVELHTRLIRRASCGCHPDLS